MSTILEKEKRLIKIKFALCKIFRQILNKDTKSSENNNNKHLMESSESGINNNCSLASEIEQNQANERLLKSKAAQTQQQQTYILAIETTVGSLYWDWECGMQRDSFADYNFNTL